MTMMAMGIQTILILIFTKKSIEIQKISLDDLETGGEDK